MDPEWLRISKNKTEWAQTNNLRQPEIKMHGRNQCRIKRFFFLINKSNKFDKK